MKILLLTFFHLLISTTSFGESIPINELIKNLQTGNIEKFEKDINESISATNSDKEIAALYKLYGDYYKLCGRIDRAVEKWKISNHYRSQAYSVNDYHKAWNYALLSNYYYEQINTPLALAYADSCTHLTQDLNEKEQLELDIHLIYNILAQSYKQNNKGLSYEEELNLYNHIQVYYKKSIEFQLKNGLSKHNLAKTYHLLGNSFLDLSALSDSKNNTKDTEKHYSKAVSQYNLAIKTWSELYGDTHFEKGKTLFLKGLMNHFLSENDPDKIDISHTFFKEAIEVFDVKRNGIKNIPNKEDFLMLLKYTCNHQIKFKPTTNYLVETENYNLLAIRVWLELVNNNKSVNQSQNLAIYHLNPFEDRIHILLEKEKNGHDLDPQEIFDALQHLKNYDLVTANNLEPNQNEFILSEFQKTLLEQDEFIDIQTIELNKTVLITSITKDDFSVHKLPLSTVKETDTLINAIINFDFSAYTEKSRLLYHRFFNKKHIEGKNIIICADGNFQKLPFEALLCSDIEINSNDYRKLDFAINHAQFSHIWNSSFLNKKTKLHDYSLTAFAPGADTLSKLPFSSQLIKFIDSERLGLAHSGVLATKKRILDVNTNILHLSGHGIIDQNQSYFSGLVINKERMSLRDVGGIEYVPKLVSINTCNSSLGKNYRGEGINGFERVFVMNGCESLLTNRWEVDDMASNEIMKLFYVNIHNGIDAREAIKKAKLTYISSSENSTLASPYYWAGHKISGQDIKFKKDDQESQNYLRIILSSILVLVGGYSLSRRFKAS